MLDECHVLTTELTSVPVPCQCHIMKRVFLIPPSPQPCPFEILAEPRLGDTETTDCIPKPYDGDGNALVHLWFQILAILVEPFKPSVSAVRAEVSFISLIDGREESNVLFLEESDLSVVSLIKNVSVGTGRAHISDERSYSASCERSA
jgi:hypothetical protein